MATMENKVLKALGEHLELNADAKSLAKGLSKVLSAKHDGDDALHAALRDAIGDVYEIDDDFEEIAAQIIAAVSKIKAAPVPVPKPVTKVVTKAKAAVAPGKGTKVASKSKSKTGSDGKKAANDYSLFVSAYAALAKVTDEDEAEVAETYEYTDRKLPEDNKTMANLLTEIEVEGETTTYLSFLESLNGKPLVSVVKALSELGTNRMKATGMLWNTLGDDLRVSVARTHCKQQ